MGGRPYIDKLDIEGLSPLPSLQLGEIVLVLGWSGFIQVIRCRQYARFAFNIDLASYPVLTEPGFPK